MSRMATVWAANPADVAWVRPYGAGIAVPATTGGTGPTLDGSTLSKVAPVRRVTGRRRIATLSDGGPIAKDVADGRIRSLVASPDQDRPGGAGGRCWWRGRRSTALGAR